MSNMLKIPVQVVRHLPLLLHLLPVQMPEVSVVVLMVLTVLMGLVAPMVLMVTGDHGLSIRKIHSRRDL